MQDEDFQLNQQYPLSVPHNNVRRVCGQVPSADVAVRIVRVLGVSVEYLITGQGISEKKGAVLLTPESRQIANIAEKLKPDYRKIALSFLEMLKKHEEKTDIDGGVFT